MADRRLPFTAQDDEGVPRQGEVLIVRAWRPDLELSPSAAFTIVLAEQPLAPGSPLPGAPNVIVCAPASPVRLPSAVAGAGDAAAAPPLRLSRRALNAYADGTLLASHPLSITAREVFSEGVPCPRLDSLAQDILAASRRAERYWQAMDGILSWPHPPARLVRPERLRARLRDALQRAPPIQRGAPGAPGRGPVWADAIGRLSEIAAGAAPETVTPFPAALADDVAFVRCLTERSEAVSDLATMRAYLEGANPGPRLRALLVDHAATREQLSFVTLLSEPHRLDGMRAAFETFRGDYVRAYVGHHDRHWQAFARLRTALDEAALAAQALARLNTLRALGRPVGRAELAAYERLTHRQSVCSRRDLESTLRERPTCPDCNVTMEDSVPSEEAQEVLRRLQAALARQQARLASEAVRRILARGGERLEQFLQIVQASDLAGLAQVLDDDLLAFLRELLSEPVSPTPEALDLFEELARAYPTVSEEQVDAVIRTLRQLLTQQLASQRAADPSRAAAFRLASVPPPPP